MYSLHLDVPPSRCLPGGMGSSPASRSWGAELSTHPMGWGCWCSSSGALHSPTSSCSGEGLAAPGSLLPLALGRMGIQQLPELLLPLCLPPCLQGRDTCCPPSPQHLRHIQVSPSSYIPRTANCNYSMGFPTALTIYTRH